MNEDRRLIEENLPIKEISEEGSKERSIRQGHISTLHLWWARKPLTVSRAAIFSSLVKNKNDIESKDSLYSQIVEICNWKNLIDKSVLERAKRIIKSNFRETPKVLDCFSGGGSIPLEASKLGCTTFSGDVNPVAYFIEKCILEYIPKYSKPVLDKNGFTQISNPLLKDFEKWSDWVKLEAKKELGDFFINNTDTDIAYLWARTIQCDKPACKREIPILHDLWLNRNSQIALKLNVEKKKKIINFYIKEGKEIDFDPSEGTLKGGSIKCPFCGGVLSSSRIRRAGNKKELGSMMIAKVLKRKQDKNISFKSPTQQDFEKYDESIRFATKFFNKNKHLILSELIPTPGGLPATDTKGTFFVHLQPVIYGFSKWGDLFNQRQALVLAIFIDKINKLKSTLEKEKLSTDYQKALISLICCSLTRLANYNTSFCQWYNTFVTQTFKGHKIDMVLNYSEINPFSGYSGSWDNAVDWIKRVIEREGTLEHETCNVYLGSAEKIPLKDEEIDAIITDPPYYDAIPYGDISEFHYVILKRIIKEYYPEAFSTIVIPKHDEILQNSSLVRRGAQLGEDRKKLISLGIKDSQYFEEKTFKAFKEINRVLKKNGILVLIFAHKGSLAWENLLNALIKADFYVTASWPIHTERPGRLASQNKAALASSIFIVCRKRLTSEEGYFNEIKDELKEKIYKKLDEFWEQGIRGADFFISAIGPAVEVFGKYKKVKKLSGEEVTVAELLNEVRSIVTDYSLHKILKDGHLGNIDDITRFYVLWRWAYGDADVPYDDARKLAQALGTEPDELLSKKGLLNKKGDKVNMLEPWERKDEHLGESKHGMPTSMIDVIHRACLLWEKGNRKALEEFIANSGYATEEILWNVAQTISEILPSGSKEKQLLQGLLNTKSTIETGKFKSQTTLESYKGERK